MYITNSDSARVRAGCGADTAQFRPVNTGEAYDCVGVAQGGWYETVYLTGETGFISNKLSALASGALSAGAFSYPIGTVTVIGPYSVGTYNGGSSTPRPDGSFRPMTRTRPRGPPTEANAVVLHASGG